MIVQIERKVFDSLPIDSVGHACFAPMVPVYQEGMRQRNGQEAHEYRTDFYKLLSQGQRALFMFFTYYDHAIRSSDEFKRISGHYLSAQIFQAIKKGVEYFNDNDMLRLFLRIEQTLLEKHQNEIFNLRMDELYIQLCEIAPYTLTKIGACIKEDPTEFICFE